MRRARAVVLASLALAILLGSLPTDAHAGDKGWDRITRYISKTYRAERQGRFAGWLAGMAVKFAKPAGVKSLKIALYSNLDLSAAPDGKGLDEAVRSGLGPEWTPVVRVITRNREQSHIYVRWRGDDVEVTIVAIDERDAAVVRAKLEPEALAEFVRDDRIAARWE